MQSNDESNANTDNHDTVCLIRQSRHPRLQQNAYDKSIYSWWRMYETPMWDNIKLHLQKIVSDVEDTASRLLASAKYSTSPAAVADVEDIDARCENVETKFKSWLNFSPEPADKPLQQPVLLLCHFHLRTTSISPEMKPVIQFTNYYKHKMLHTLHRLSMHPT